MPEAIEEAALAVLKGLVALAPTFGAWLADIIDRSGDDSPNTRRVRDILPVRSASRAVADALTGKDPTQ